MNIHCNGTYLDYIKVRNFVKVNDFNLYVIPSKIVLQLTHKDLWIDFYYEYQAEIKKLTCGEELKMNGIAAEI